MFHIVELTATETNPVIKIVASYSNLKITVTQLKEYDSFGKDANYYIVKSGEPFIINTEKIEPGEFKTNEDIAKVYGEHKLLKEVRKNIKEPEDELEEMSIKL